MVRVVELQAHHLLVPQVGSDHVRHRGIVCEMVNEMVIEDQDANEEDMMTEMVTDLVVTVATEETIVVKEAVVVVVRD